jgi:DNA-directed RNA polymerase subunit RPC12/RpoP
MKAFKFACPVCGQHINADADNTGSQIECPTCFQKIVVPQAPASEDAKFILSASQVRKPRPLGTPEEPALATGSSKVPWLVVVLAGLLLCGAAAAFVFRGTIFKSSQPQTQVVTKTEGSPVTIPATPDARWKLDLTEMAFPDTAAAGRIHGSDFTCDRAVLQNGLLTLRRGRSGPADLSLSIQVGPKQGEDLSAKNLNITTTSAPAPRVTLRWKNDGQPSASAQFNKGYAMKLQLDQAAGGKAAGKIYLCTPDDAKSFVVGTFAAEVRKPKPPKKPS